MSGLYRQLQLQHGEDHLQQLDQHKKYLGLQNTDDKKTTQVRCLNLLVSTDKTTMCQSFVY